MKEALHYQYWYQYQYTTVLVPVTLEKPESESRDLLLVDQYQVPVPGTLPGLEPGRGEERQKQHIPLYLVR